MESKKTLRAIVNRKMPEFLKSALRADFIDVLDSCKVNLLDTGILKHADIQIHFLKSDLAVCAPEFYPYYRNLLPSDVSLYPGSTHLQSTYPHDCAYNIARTADFAVGNLKYADPVIKQWYRTLQVPMLHVNQGYAKCNICVIGEHALITEDKGIYRAVTALGKTNCLLLEPGEVRLDGFPHGFFGGACGTADTSLYLCGSLAHFKQKEKLLDFLRSHHTAAVELSPFPIEDYGSILFF